MLSKRVPTTLAIVLVTGSEDDSKSIAETGVTVIEKIMANASIKDNAFFFIMFPPWQNGIMLYKQNITEQSCCQ
jgi:hypothetical protein